MFVDENMIIDIEQNARLEAELISCLMDENHRVLFSVDIVLDVESNNKEFVMRQLEKNRAWLDFFEERTVESTDDNFLELPFFEEGKTYWFAPRNYEELRKVIEHRGIGYGCFIVDKDKSIKNFLLEIWVYEHLEYKGKECRGMTILPHDITISWKDKMAKMKKIVDIYIKEAGI